MNKEGTMDVSAQIAAFLDGAGWGGASVSALAGDASFRRYFRIRGEGGQCGMLMHAPPPHEDPRPFVDVTRYLLSNGFRAPVLYAEDLAQGFLLIEDFGDRRMREHIDATPVDERAIYQAAVETLVELEKAPVADVPPYDMNAYMREVRLLSEWYLPAMGVDFDAAEYDGLWTEALLPISIPEWRNVTVLRDYHAENIMLLDDGGQGLIDYQDALAGHPAYDLVSILQDARRDVSPDLERAMLDYHGQLSGAGAEFRLHYALLGAQRNTKIIGIFTRLWQRDGKARYLDFLPRMWGLLERDLAHPELAPLKRWFDLTIPPDIRHASPLERVS
jgi:aminoglycoside/choline kinase family phosphotransferase